MKNILAIIVLLTTFSVTAMEKVDTPSSSSTVIDLPGPFVKAQFVNFNIKWEILSNYSLFLFNKRSGIWLIDPVYGRMRFFKAIAAEGFSYNASYVSTTKAVISLSNGGGNYICDYDMCHVDNMTLLVPNVRRWLNYFDKNYDLRAIWNGGEKALSISYFYRTIRDAGNKKAWLERLNYDQNLVLKQDTLVFSEPMPNSRETKNQIFDLDDGSLQNEIFAKEFSPIKLTSNGHFWYSEASDSYIKSGVVRAGFVGAKDEINLQSYEDQIIGTMQDTERWDKGKMLLLDAMEHFADSFLIVRFIQNSYFNHRIYLSLFNLKTGNAIVLKDQTSKFANVSRVWRIDLNKNRVFAQTDKSEISVWDSNGTFIGTIKSKLDHISDLRLSGENLYLIDFVNGKLEKIKIEL